jgi:hypothetical protein
MEHQTHQSGRENDNDEHIALCSGRHVCVLDVDLDVDTQEMKSPTSLVRIIKPRDNNHQPSTINNVIIEKLSRFCELLDQKSSPDSSIALLHELLVLETLNGLQFNEGREHIPTCFGIVFTNELVPHRLIQSVVGTRQLHQVLQDDNMDYHAMVAISVQVLAVLAMINIKKHVLHNDCATHNIMVDTKTDESTYTLTYQFNDDQKLEWESKYRVYLIDYGQSTILKDDYVLSCCSKNQEVSPFMNYISDWFIFLFSLKGESDIAKEAGLTIWNLWVNQCESEKLFKGIFMRIPCPTLSGDIAAPRLVANLKAELGEFDPYSFLGILLGMETPNSPSSKAVASMKQFECDTRMLTSFVPSCVVPKLSPNPESVTSLGEEADIRLALDAEYTYSDQSTEHGKNMATLMSYQTVFGVGSIPGYNKLVAKRKLIPESKHLLNHDIIAWIQTLASENKPLNNKLDAWQGQSAIPLGDFVVAIQEYTDGDERTDELNKKLDEMIEFDNGLEGLIGSTFKLKFNDDD